MIVLSSDELNKLWPSLEKSTHRTAAVCALNTVDSPLTLGIHKRTFLSFEPDAIKWPDGEKHTEWTASYREKIDDWWRKIMKL